MLKTDHVQESIYRLIGEKQWLSAKDLVHLGIAHSEDTLARWRRDGFGPLCHRFSAGKFLYEKHNVMQWIENCLIPQNQTDPQQSLKAHTEEPSPQQSEVTTLCI